ncbi:MAG: glyoxalase [Gallionellales bacterium RBG_16_56_9]|nr:MAG: glyoxalase [Gallionellales bacterium RBG_16_56_9]
MKRFHVHVAVDNLAESIGFYSAMFATSPSVEKADYAKWMLDDPRMNFAISQRGAQVGVNHLGIQVESDEELQQMQSRLESLQPGLSKDDGVACCYAKSDKYWVTDPSGLAWETFHSLATIPVFGKARALASEAQAKPGCCVPAAEQAASVAKCC